MCTQRIVCFVSMHWLIVMDSEVSCSHCCRIFRNEGALSAHWSKNAECLENFSTHIAGTSNSNQTQRDDVSYPNGESYYTCLIIQPSNKQVWNCQGCLRWMSLWSFHQQQRFKRQWIGWQSHCSQWWWLLKATLLGCFVQTLWCL